MKPMWLRRAIFFRSDRLRRWRVGVLLSVVVKKRGVACSKCGRAGRRLEGARKGSLQATWVGVLAMLAFMFGSDSRDRRQCRRLCSFNLPSVCGITRLAVRTGPAATRRMVVERILWFMAALSAVHSPPCSHEVLHFNLQRSGQLTVVDAAGGLFSRHGRVGAGRCCWIFRRVPL